MRATKVDVLVIGAGVIGMSLAHELQKQGRKVLAVDRGEPGFGCSYGNAGWITPCFAMPLPQPGMLLKSIGWLFDPESPLYIKPQPSLLLARWMWNFMRAMNQKKLEESVGALTDISKYSLQFYAKMSERLPYGFEQKGLLMVSATDAGIKAAEIERKLMEERGIEGRFLDGTEVRKIEPSLRDLVKGGVYFPTEAHAEPLETVKTLVKEFTDAGGQTLSRAEVYNFEFEGTKIKTVMTTRGNFQADLVVLAVGSWSPSLGRQLGVRLPIMGGKGYSMIVDEFDIKPKHPIMIIERKIAVTPRADSVRLAGTLELVDQDDQITPRRVQAILKGSQEYLHIKKDPTVKELWRGLRPCTPDGVPMIGFSDKWSNLFYNLGHQMLGLQSAPGSAKLAADLIGGAAPLTDPKPFRASRFE